MKKDLFEGVQIIEEVEITGTARVLSHGNRLYLSIRKADAEFWDIQKGDHVAFKIFKIKRTKRTM